MAINTLIEQTPEPRTIQSITEDLHRLGVSDGMTIVAHASLSSLGWVCGGEAAVVQALLNAIGESGTLVMPANSSDYSDPSLWKRPPVPEAWCPIIRDTMPPFDPHTTPTSGMGRIAECFRTWPGTRRSNHPATSFCAKGPNADVLLRDHRLEDSLGIDSPLGTLYKVEASILLMGVGHESNTSLHLAECLSGTRPRKKEGAAIMLDGQREWVWYSDVDYSTCEFLEIGRRFEQTCPDCVQRALVGSADSRLLPVKQLVDFAVGWFRTGA